MTTFITKEGKFKTELKRRIEMLMTYLDPLLNIVKRQLAFQMTYKWLIAFFFFNCKTPAWYNIQFSEGRLNGNTNSSWK